MRAVAQISNEGGRTCPNQVKSPADPIQQEPSANEWSSIQNNNNNEYYLSLADGSYNNNNKNNNYWVVPVESKELAELVFKAESDCWQNKHSSWDANKYHYHAGRRVFEFIDALGSKTYKPWKSYCFVVMYPKPREIFAAHYQDRIAHHIAAPYMIAVAEAVHSKNGNVSFGNRKQKSSYHACLRVQQMMRKHPNGYIATIDLQGYFMSIDRNMAWRVFCEYEAQHRPMASKNEREFYMWLIELLLKNDPSANCERRSPQRLWDEHIRPHKSLFGNKGNGLPIGNYYSQIIANLIPERVCECASEYDLTEFVDDFAIVTDSVAQVREAERKIDKVLKELGLERNRHKRYIQPVRHGVLWCGHMIYADRIYTSNRTIRNCQRKLEDAMLYPSLRAARRLQQTLNSYFGMMAHASEYKTQRRIADKVLGSRYAEWLRFDEKPHHLICRIKDEYKRSKMSAEDIRRTDEYIKYKSNMIVMPVKKGSKHYERTMGGFVYRYGYQPIAGNDDYVSAAVDETRTRLKEADIRKRVTDYCASVGVHNEYDPADYGY